MSGSENVYGYIYMLSTGTSFPRNRPKSAIKRHILGIVDCWWGISQSNGYNKS